MTISPLPFTPLIPVLATILFLDCHSKEHSPPQISTAIKSLAFTPKFSPRIVILVPAANCKVKNVNELPGYVRPLSRLLPCSRYSPGPSLGEMPVTKDGGPILEHLCNKINFSNQIKTKTFSHGTARVGNATNPKNLHNKQKTSELMFFVRVMITAY